MTTGTETGRRTCVHCGANIARNDTKFCEYCGTEQPRLAAPVPAPSPGALDHEARFSNLAAHADLDALMLREPSAMGIVAPRVALIAFGIIWVVLTFGMAVVFKRTAGGAMAMWPMFIGLVGFVMLIFAARSGGKVLRAPLTRELARVLDDRTHVSGGKHGARTIYYVTLEFADGARRELITSGKVAGAVARDDMGVAYLKGDALVDFGRVSV